MLDKESFLKDYKLQRRIDSCPIEWNILSDIYEDYEKRMPELEKTALSLADIFNQHTISGKHSISFRAKKGEHLIEKIVRNSINGDAEKYRKIRADNYYKLITDLVGVRILILEKGNWEGIHTFIMNTFENKEEHYINIWQEEYNYEDAPKAMWIVEQPKAYIRFGDNDIYEGKIERKYTYKDYRSIHYIVKYRNYYCEIQVRTLAEEIYGEFDHQVRYPYRSENKFLKRYTSTLSKVMMATDEMLTLCLHLPDQIIEQCDACFQDENYPLWKREETDSEEEHQTENREQTKISSGSILNHVNSKMKKK